MVGHKVGLSSEAMQKMMGVDEPDYGHLLADMEVFEDQPVPAGRFLFPRVEVEEMGPRIDFRVGRVKEADEAVMKEALKKPKQLEVYIICFLSLSLTLR